MVRKGFLSGVVLFMVILPVLASDPSSVPEDAQSLLSAFASYTDLLVIAEFPGVSEAMKASIALNKALGITFATVPAIGLEDFDKLVGAKR